jgi:hypothetical protein
MARRVRSRVRFRKRAKLLPFLFINLSNSGASLSAKLGPLSWNTRRRRTARVDLPGPFSTEHTLEDEDAPAPRRRRR